MRYLRVPLTLVIFTLAGCAAKDSPWKGKPAPRILATFPPLASIAMNVIREYGTVISLATTTGVHDRGDPNAREINLAREADIIFANGLNLETPYLKKLKVPAGNAKWNVVELGSAIDKKALLEGEADHDHAAGEAHDHPADPHVWLSPVNAKIFAVEIENGLDRLFATDGRYAPGRRDYIEKLAALLAYGKGILKDKKERKFVSFHDSLQYFARDFDLEIAGVVEFEPGVEPGSKQMAELIEACIKNKVRVIAVEPQFSSKNAATTIRDALKQKGIDAIFVEIDPMETAETVTAEFYIDTMRKNLDNLAAALK